MPSSQSNGGRTAARDFYSTPPGAQGYHIPQDTTWRDPQNRKMRVLTIGAGVSGILMAYLVQKECQNVEHVVYEKNEDIGGTWLENRYPCAACDIPSHAYSYQFAPPFQYPDWPRFFSQSPEIWTYLDLVCKTFDLRKYMTFQTTVTGCYWQQDKGQWLVKLRQAQPGREPREFEENCNLLLHGTGVLNDWKWPNIPGLHDKFKGRVVHTARWPADYAEEQWKKERIAVIGSGSSSLQTVPGMQPHARHMDIFVRTGAWFTVIAGNTGDPSKTYTDEERARFHADPAAMLAHAKSIEDDINGLWGFQHRGSETQEAIKAQMAERTRQKLNGNERLVEGLKPGFGFGCRRINPADPYLEAIQQPNVDVHFTPAAECTERGVVGADGVEREVDTVVCATGFDTSFAPRFPVVGRSGADLRDRWAPGSGGCPESYLGLAVPDLPNFITFVGPPWPVQNGSFIGPLQSVGLYAVKMIHKMQNEGVRSWTPRADVTEDFNKHVQEWIKTSVYTDDCRSWYKNNDTGRVNAIWPGSSLHYIQVIETPRYEDFEMEYCAKNRWAMLGMGFTVAERNKEGADLSPYLKLENIDAKWLNEVILGGKGTGPKVDGNGTKGTNGNAHEGALDGDHAKI
ncbi:hypothetical protein RB597_010342 [Gaeumannomyces tritici]